MDKYRVYVHISPDSKRYYGATKLNINNRWRNGKGYKTQKYFWEAIQKYGWDNIQHIVIAKGLTKDEAYWLEEELIKIWDTTNREKGYNIALGGESGNSWIPTDETKKKMRENHPDFSGKNNPRAKSVICITTGRIFYTAKEGADYYNTSKGNIVDCCKGKRKSAGKLNGTKLVWRYLVWNHKKIYRKCNK